MSAFKSEQSSSDGLGATPSSMGDLNELYRMQHAHGMLRPCVMSDRIVQPKLHAAYARDEIFVSSRSADLWSDASTAPAPSWH